MVVSSEGATLSACDPYSAADFLTGMIQRWSLVDGAIIDNYGEKVTFNPAGSTVNKIIRLAQMNPRQRRSLRMLFSLVPKVCQLVAYF